MVWLEAFLRSAAQEERQKETRELSRLGRLVYDLDNLMGTHLYQLRTANSLRHRSPALVFQWLWRAAAEYSVTREFPSLLRTAAFQ